MSVVKEWKYVNDGQEIEDYASYIIANAKNLVRIFELMEDDDEKKNWLSAGRLLSQSIWEYADQITTLISSQTK